MKMEEPCWLFHESGNSGICERNLKKGKYFQKFQVVSFDPTNFIFQYSEHAVQ